MNTIRLARPEKEFGTGSPSTIQNDLTSLWAIKLLGKFSQKEKNKNLSGTETTIRSEINPFIYSENNVLRKGLKTVLTNRSTSLAVTNLFRILGAHPEILKEIGFERKDHVKA